MSNRAGIIAGIVVFLIAYIGLATYSVKTGQRNQAAAKAILGEFYQCSQQHNYTGAYQLLSRDLQSRLDEKTLATRWQEFEKVHGPIKNWRAAGRGRIGADKVNIWPSFVDFTHWIYGQKNGPGIVAVRIVPEGKIWRIDRLSIQP